MGYIYKILNLSNNKVYIGKTTKPLEDRFNQHLKCAKNHVNRYLYDAMNKYGYDKFKICLIEECMDEDLNEREKYYISMYKSNQKDFGYNMTVGGDGGDTWSSNNHKLETALKIKNTKIKNGTWGKGAPKGGISPNKDKLKYDINIDEFYNDIVNGMTIEELTKKYLISRKSIYNRCNKFFGKPYAEIRGYSMQGKVPRTMSEETKIKLSEQRRVLVLKENNPNYKNVDRNELYKLICDTELSIEQIASIFNVSYPTIYLKCKEYFNKTPMKLRKGKNVK